VPAHANQRALPNSQRRGAALPASRGDPAGKAFEKSPSERYRRATARRPGRPSARHASTATGSPRSSSGPVPRRRPTAATKGPNVEPVGDVGGELEDENLEQHAARSGRKSGAGNKQGTSNLPLDGTLLRVPSGSKLYPLDGWRPSRAIGISAVRGQVRRCCWTPSERGLHASTQAGCASVPMPV
jgi:hypothetical protein